MLAGAGGSTSGASAVSSLTPVEVEVVPVAKTELAVVGKKPVKRFVPPMLENIYEYMKEKEVDDIGEANKFNDFYQSNGWKVGKNKMVNWKAAVRNWLKGYKAKTKGTDILQLSANSNWEEGINEIF